MTKRPIRGDSDLFRGGHFAEPRECAARGENKPPVLAFLLEPSLLAHGTLATVHQNCVFVAQRRTRRRERHTSDEDKEGVSGITVDSHCCAGLYSCRGLIWRKKAAMAKLLFSFLCVKSL